MLKTERMYPGGRGPLLMGDTRRGVGLTLRAEPEPEFDPWLAASPFTHKRGDASGLGPPLPCVGVEPVEEAKQSDIC